MNRILYDLAGAENERFSPYCWRAKMALRHKGLAFKAEPVEFTKIKTIADGAQKRVPVLEDNGIWVHDSLVIAAYLEDTYDEMPTLFGGERGKATARFVEAFCNTTLHPLILRCVIMDIHNHLTAEDQKYFRQSREALFSGTTLEDIQAGREETRSRLQKSLTPLRQILTHQSYIGGDNPLFHDYIMYGSLKWPSVISDFQLLEDDDPIKVWFENLDQMYD